MTLWLSYLFSRPHPMNPQIKHIHKSSDTPQISQNFVSGGCWWYRHKGQISSFLNYFFRKIKKPSVYQFCKHFQWKKWPHKIPKIAEASDLSLILWIFDRVRVGSLWGCSSLERFCMSSKQIGQGWWDSSSIFLDVF